nr:precorrin-6y C5,15-methyltransferase (decarboxylating) subunit CbiE [uncultured Sellimonas sp.]
MKRIINLIGIGTGAETELTVTAMEKIKDSDILIGAKRMLESTKPYHKRTVCTYSSYKEEEIMAFLKEEQEGVTSILYSGDTGFYSGAEKMAHRLEREGMDVVIYPGISSIASFAAKCNTTWQNAALVSLHGTTQNAIYEINTHASTFLLLGGEKGARELLDKLNLYGMGNLEAVSGKNLSYDTEEIHRGKVKEFTGEMLDGLSVFLVKNPEYDKRVSLHLKDEDFVRGEIPMTKRAVRANILAGLELSSDSVLYDVGAGTGSVSVEAALQSGNIRVFAIEKNPKAIHLMEENKKKFRADNIEIIEGTAPKILEELPIPTHVFIGGSSGNLKEIVEVCLKKNPDVRIVLTAVSMETIKEMTDLLNEPRWEEAEVMQISASQGKKLGAYHMMMAQNPVFLATLQKRRG